MLSKKDFDLLAHKFSIDSWLGDNRKKYNLGISFFNINHFKKKPQLVRMLNRLKPVLKFTDPAEIIADRIIIQNDPDVLKLISKLNEKALKFNWDRANRSKKAGKKLNLKELKPWLEKRKKKAAKKEIKPLRWHDYYGRKNG